MNRTSTRLSLPKLALFGGAVAATAAVSLFGPGLGRVRAALQDSPKAVLDEAWQIVNREYVDGNFNQVDWKATRQSLLSKNYSSNKEAYQALRKALEKLGDPYTRFMDPAQYRSLTDQTSGELSGVGIRLEVSEKSKVLTVVEPIENSPALKAGIKTGDHIVSINGKSTQGMTVEDASNLIRGDVGTKVNLEIRRSGTSDFTVALTRARIELPTVRYTLNQQEQMRKAIKGLSDQKVDGFVLDLRGNPGGLLQASVEISRMWMDQGAIVRTVDRKGKSEELANNQTAMTKLPMVVLVDGNSASSSEILTGALKDNGRAVIVGSQTFGKALVQSVHNLSDGSGLAVTIAHYYTPKGTDISHKGISPDIKIDLTEQDKKELIANPKWFATMKDPQYSKAVTELEKIILAQPQRNTPERQAVNLQK
jgi:carboxyl-terminal processing protease